MYVDTFLPPNMVISECLCVSVFICFNVGLNYICGFLSVSVSVCIF